MPKVNFLRSKILHKQLLNNPKATFKNSKNHFLGHKFGQFTGIKFVKIANCFPVFWTLIPQFRLKTAQTNFKNCFPPFQTVYNDKATERHGKSYKNSKPSEKVVKEIFSTLPIPRTYTN